MELLFSFVGFVILISFGLVVGQIQERRHFNSLRLREQLTADMFVTQLKRFPHAVASPSPPSLVIGEVVIATDYLKSFQAKIRKIFGGRLGSYQTLLDRARREALLRVIEQAQDQGYNAVCNVRLETADLGGNTSRRRVAMVGMLVSGTAYHAAPPVS